MKRSTISSIMLMLLACLPTVLAQDVTTYEKIYYSEPAIVQLDSDDFQYSLEIKNGVAQIDESKFALKISNESTDILLFKPDESTFKFEFGEKHPSADPIVLLPGKSKTKTMMVNGGSQFRQEKYSYECGGVYRIPVAGDVVKAEDYQLPASKNSFTVGDFEVVLKSYKASTKEAKAVFECTYIGDKVGLINSSNLAVRANRNKSDEELVFANDEKKSDTEVLRKGDKVKFNATFHIEGRIVDMQFATMYIVWNDTFVETTASSVEPVVIEVVMDEGLTNAKK